MGVQDLINSFKVIIPPLTNTLHKGMMGRIGIFGGSPEYTGAPYFAGISALKAGADLVYVFSASSAAPVIKCYTPEMMVMPYLDSEDAIGLISPWLSRLHSVLIGPGLGRRNKTFSVITQVIKSLKTMRIEQTFFQPLIFDADGLYYVMKNVDLVKDYPGDIYLTPNQVEFTNLVNSLVGYDCRESTNKKFELINQYLGSRVTVVLKGNTDLICSSNKVFECDVEGSPRRCGGQGDMLCGILSVFTHWISEHKKCQVTDGPVEDLVPPNVLGGVGACALMRTCNRLAFEKKSRSTVTSDMIEEIHIGFNQLFS